MQIDIGKNQKEIKEHGTLSFPVNVSEESIGLYEGGAFLWHWHPEIELTLILSGQIQYHINGKEYFLTKGEGMFGNSNTLHSGYQSEGAQCSYLSVTFHPRFIYGYENSLLQTKYVDFITSNNQWDSLKLCPDIVWQQEILQVLKTIHTLSSCPPTDYEMQLHLLLCRVWQQLYRFYCALPSPQVQTTGFTDRLKKILSYIQNHYREPLTLDDIASHVNICKSECCRFFKKHMHMTMFEYLMFFRVQQSIPCLKDGASVSEAAALSGFSDPCYYGKVFKRYLSCSPSQYKKTRNEQGSANVP